MREVISLLGAEIDFQSAYERCFDLRRADRLDMEIRAALGRLALNPWASSIWDGEFRRHRVTHSFYGLFYTVEGPRVLVHAMLDLRQDPRLIRRRLGLPE